MSPHTNPSDPETSQIYQLPPDFVCASGLVNRIHIDTMRSDMAEIKATMKTMSETISQMKMLVALAGVTIFLNFVSIIERFFIK